MIHMISTTSKYQVEKVSPGHSPMVKADGLRKAVDRLQMEHGWTMDVSSHPFTLVHFNHCAIAPFTIMPCPLSLGHSPRPPSKAAV